VALTKRSGLQKDSSAERFNASEMALLSSVVGHTFDLQHQYGKTPSQIETLVRGFAWALRGYPMETIVNAFREYVLRKGDVPSPSDIINIINPQKEPWTPDWKVYEALKERKKAEGEFALTTEEEEYIKACEEWSINRFKER